MRLTLFVFAEYAALTRENKLCIAGVFDSVNVSRAEGTKGDLTTTVPLPNSFLVAALEASISEGTKHKAALQILDDDGKAVADTIDIGEFAFIVNPHGRPMKFQAVIGVRGIAVPRPGDYTFVLLMDGKPVGETMLYVTDVTGQQ